LTASGGVSYAWSGSETDAAIEVEAGTYTVTVTDANGCSAEASATVDTHQVMDANITGGLDVCPGETTTLTASAGDAFLWSNEEVTQSIEVGVGFHDVTITDANGCEASTATNGIEVVQNALPTFSFPQDAACAPDLLSYSIQLQTGTGNVVTANTGTVNDLGGGLWEITNVAANEAIEANITNATTNCSIPVTIPAKDCNCPAVAAPTSDGDSSICADENIPALSVSGVEASLTVHWYDALVGGNQIGTGATYTPTEAGTYYAEAIDLASACASLRTPVILTINTLPTVAITASSEGACANENVTLSASGATTYLWDTQENTAEITSVPGTYTVTGTDSNGCTNTATQTVTAFAAPTVDVDHEEVLCGAEFAVATASGGDTYTWSTGEIGESIEVVAGTYSVTAANNEGCTDEQMFTIVQAEEATANLGADQDICNETVTLRPGNYAPGSMMFEWSDGSTGETLAVSTGGDYQVTVTDGCGEEAVSSIRIFELTPIDSTLLEAALGPDTTNCAGPVRFDLSDAQLGDVGDVSFRWGNSGNTSNGERFLPNGAGEVTVAATSGCGETVTASVEIEECEICSFYVPNTFSPNGDLINDEFVVSTNCEVTNYQLKIFDRWGSLMFESNDTNAAWDGMFKGERPNSNTFIWMMSYDIVDRYGVTRTRTDSGSLTL
ncbi:MAG: gliding motility-associated C-terminal domain-containing protein, partial [Bacteroidota bacterium]